MLSNPKSYQSLSSPGFNRIRHSRVFRQMLCSPFPAKSTFLLIAIICIVALPASAQKPDTLFSTKSPFEEAGGFFGFSVSGAGDVNMDGKADVIVGARNEDPGSSPSGAGRAYVFEFPVFTPASVRKKVSVTPLPAAKMAGDS